MFDDRFQDSRHPGHPARHPVPGRRRRHARAPHRGSRAEHQPRPAHGGVLRELGRSAPVWAGGAAGAAERRDPADGHDGPRAGEPLAPDRPAAVPVHHGGRVDQHQHRASRRRPDAALRGAEGGAGADRALCGDRLRPARAEPRPAQPAGREARLPGRRHRDREGRPGPGEDR